MYDTKFKTTLTDKAFHAPSRLSKQQYLIIQTYGLPDTRLWTVVIQNVLIWAIINYKCQYELFTLIIP